MSMRWTPETLKAFQAKCEQRRAGVRVVTHKLKLAEFEVLEECLEVLALHPNVAFAWRQNTGLAFNGNQAVRFAFKGCSDILGCLTDGRFLAIECKATGKTAKPEQQAFLDAVNRAGGLGLCVDDPKLLAEALKRA